MRPLVPPKSGSLNTTKERQELQPAYQRIKCAVEWQRASNQVECQSLRKKTTAREAEKKSRDEKLEIGKQKQIPSHEKLASRSRDTHFKEPASDICMSPANSSRAACLGLNRRKPMPGHL